MTFRCIITPQLNFHSSQKAHYNIQSFPLVYSSEYSSKFWMNVSTSIPMNYRGATILHANSLNHMYNTLFSLLHSSDVSFTLLFHIIFTFPTFCLLERTTSSVYRTVTVKTLTTETDKVDHQRRVNSDDCVDHEGVV